MRSAERSQSALTRACVMESVPSAPHLSPRPTSLPATERLKSASMGAAQAPSVRSMGLRRAPVPAKMARMRLSFATCAAWRR